MKIEEAEAAVKSAEAALRNAKAAAEEMVAPFRVALEEAGNARLAALAEAHPLKVGDIVERQTWKKTDRIKITGFRHYYGRKLKVVGNPLKKDGTPSVIEREFYEDDKLRKVDPCT